MLRSASEFRRRLGAGFLALPKLVPEVPVVWRRSLRRFCLVLFFIIKKLARFLARFGAVFGAVFGADFGAAFGALFGASFGAVPIRMNSDTDDQPPGKKTTPRKENKIGSSASGGRTCVRTLRLHDTAHKLFTRRHLFVGLSRAKSCFAVDVAE